MRNLWNSKGINIPWKAWRFLSAQALDQQYPTGMEMASYIVGTNFSSRMEYLSWHDPPHYEKGELWPSLLVTNTLMRKICLEPQNPTRTMKLKTILQTARRQMGNLEYGIRTWNGTMETAIVSLIDTWWVPTRCQFMCQVLVSYREESMASWPSEDS